MSASSPRRSRSALRSWRWRPSIPADTDNEDAVAADLLEAVALLGAGRPAEAAERLARVDAALVDSPDLADVRARVLSLRAQAALGSGAPADARAHAQQAMRALKALGDEEGLTAVRALDVQIAAELDRERREAAARAKAADLAATPMSAILARTEDALARADALIRHAGALTRVDRRAEAAESARHAVIEADRAGAVRERVLARLALVECAPEQARSAVLEALAIADAANETTLIGIVAQSARLAGVALPGHRGPLEGT